MVPKKNSHKKIFIKTFGCQMNQYDSNRILDITKKLNYSLTEDKGNADCYVINTCHIREKATEKVFHDIGRVKKEYKDKKKPILIITGCVAQAEGDLILKNENYVDAVVGPQSYHQIDSIIKKIENHEKKINITEFDAIEKFDKLKTIKNGNSKVSSFLTIQEGCDKFCKFCVVPYTRGPEHSRDFDEIINEAEVLIDKGAKELTLLGQNVNAYNYNSKRISEIIIRLNKNKKIKRIRYTTSHPHDMTKDLIKAHKDCKKLMPLLHLPIQSGSDKILKMMNRKHNVSRYLETIDLLKNDNSKIQFSSDFIIGYPGETVEDFEATCKLMKKIKFITSYSYIFSPRPGTPASELDLVDKTEAKKRLLFFQSLSDEIRFNYKKGLINTTVNTLFENKVGNNQYFGRDQHLNPVITMSKENIIGQEKKVLIKKFSKQTIYGDIIKSKNHLAA